MMLGGLLSVFLLSISCCFFCQVQRSHIYTLNASQAQAGTESGPATASEITVQSPSSQWGLCPIPVPIITWWHCYIWHQITVTTSSVSLLCNSPLYCCLGSEGGLSDLARDIGKYLASLDWPAESLLSIEQEDCIMRYFDTIWDKIAVQWQTESESLCDCQRIVQRYAMIWMILWWWLEL